MWKSHHEIKHLKRGFNCTQCHYCGATKAKLKKHRRRNHRQKKKRSGGPKGDIRQEDEGHPREPREKQGAEVRRLRKTMEGKTLIILEQEARIRKLEEELKQKSRQLILAKRLPEHPVKKH